MYDDQLPENKNNNVDITGQLIYFFDMKYNVKHVDIIFIKQMTIEASEYDAPRLIRAAT